jgi:ketosteroid isomerase-like protein
MTADLHVGPATAVASAYRFYRCVDDGDVPGLAALFTVDATYHRPGYEPILGREGISRFYSRDRVIRAGRHTLTTAVATGEEVAVRGEFHGVLHDGSPVDLRFADFFELDPEGRFTRRDTFFFAPLV